MNEKNRLIIKRGMIAKTLEEEHENKNNNNEAFNEDDERKQYEQAAKL